jgi:Xaa-Pro dipeptidase
MSLKRRTFISLTSMAAGASAFAGSRSMQTKNPSAKLSSIMADVTPISAEERMARIKKAQRLLNENKMQALILDAGTSMEYFTGIQWGASERTMIAIIPASGGIKYICPGFEEARLKELISIGKEVHAWQEDESPYQLTVNILKDAGIESGMIGIEERLRFFIMDGLRKAAPTLEFISGDPITIPCRIIKSAAELALMQKASDTTSAAIKAGISKLREGISSGELANIVAEAHIQQGAEHDFALCLFGEASSFPHGTRQPRNLKNGDIVLMDCGCKVEGYCSDITRTTVFGASPTKRQLEIWNLEQKAQTAGFAAAKPGVACEAVDAAARKVITDAGFGPGYKLPGLPHRTGHGIGTDGHEWGNMVKGNKLLFEPGMCFSVEPTIAIPGEFGVRLEDCAYMTATGPKWFSKTSSSIFEPFGI